MRRILLASELVFACVAGFAAASRAEIVPEVRPLLGMFVPTGDHRDLLKDAALVGGQGASRTTRPTSRATGDWARSSSSTSWRSGSKGATT